MSKYKDMAMDKASGLKTGASNLKGGVKGKVNGVLGRKSTNDNTNHVAAPLSSLRDPASFAPPPKRTNSGLAPPPPPTAPVKRSAVTAPSKYQDPRTAKDEPLQRISNERRLLEAPPDADEDRPPSLPYRMNTTGLATDYLPPPPTRRDGANERSPPSYDSTMVAKRLPPTAPFPVSSVGSGPTLPPRLPPRSSSQSPERVSPLPAPGTLNQGAVSRLGAAGISVPAFGIGSSKPSDDDAPGPPKPPRPSAPQLTSLQNRFSKLGTSSSTESVSTPPTEGTTWAQKQAALKTASAFQKDPSSVSFADAKAAASTANNFRQRHGDQVAAGLKTANNLNQKYGVADKVGGFATQQSSARESTSSIASAASGMTGKKKPPPPPPKRKPGFAGDAPTAPGGDDAPPPVPLATRPTF